MPPHLSTRGLKVLVTGGAGFIGSTVCSALVDAGHVPVVLDDLSTGRREFARGRAFYEGDIADGTVVGRILAEHPDIACTIHCAAAIVVPESVAEPLDYYDNNVARSVRLFGLLAAHGKRRVLFSSSASIYAADHAGGVDEAAPLAPGSPYARTKAMIERVLADAAAAGALEAVSLRYFNPIGADPLLRTGLAMDRPSHALGRLIEAWESGTPFALTGVDWPTRDGTGLRDYVHVWDLARAHVRAVERFDDLIAAGREGHLALNLGTGRGTTVRELVEAFGRAVGTPVPVVETARRPGDVAGAYARSRHDPALLGWRPELTVADGIRHALAWRERWLALNPAA
ncbi:UDP-glucose 4-epimerase GalE [Nocardioides sp. BP30]|uniref:UDP-glucose 4-epimerase GalE n=1 Tax=Nocardioides sp. BP30 TaxID=3036374 RepID=UPI002468DF87|nr:UDP-glucose 4-epimerase GalE [Nocardioides sp. BP30]WGL50995.1 UDP-glucose 4-epimerase GalE [Nocardioides sp. BP30]